MRIKLLVSRSGSDGAFNRGDEIEVPDDEARRMIDAGQCLPMRAAEVETAVRRLPREKAAK